MASAQRHQIRQESPEQYRGNVLDDIRDFMRRLPQDVKLAFPKAAATRRAIDLQLVQFRRKPDPERRRQDLARMGWLGLRFGMTPAAIARRVAGFSALEVLRLLQAATDSVPAGSDAEQVRKGAHLAADVPPIVPTEVGITKDRKRRLTSDELQERLKSANRAARAPRSWPLRLLSPYPHPTSSCRESSTGSTRRRRDFTCPRGGRTVHRVRYDRGEAIRTLSKSDQTSIGSPLVIHQKVVRASGHSRALYLLSRAGHSSTPAFAIPGAIPVPRRCPFQSLSVLFSPPRCGTQRCAEYA